jgi:hypothetical protein
LHLVKQLRESRFSTEPLEKYDNPPAGAAPVLGFRRR